MESVQRQYSESSELRSHLVSALQLAEHLSAELDRTRAERDRLTARLAAAQGKANLSEVA